MKLHWSVLIEMKLTRKFCILFEGIPDMDRSFIPAWYCVFAGRVNQTAKALLYLNWLMIYRLSWNDKGAGCHPHMEGWGWLVRELWGWDYEHRSMSLLAGWNRLNKFMFILKKNQHIWQECLILRYGVQLITLILCTTPSHAKIKTHFLIPSYIINILWVWDYLILLSPANSVSHTICI